jgi:hypothetical protein
VAVEGVEMRLSDMDRGVGADEEKTYSLFNVKRPPIRPRGQTARNGFDCRDASLVCPPPVFPNHTLPLATLTLPLARLEELTR